MKHDVQGGLIGGVEAGGTKFDCALATCDGHVLARERFTTRFPDETLSDVIDFFLAGQARYGALKALGIGSFGPLSLSSNAPDFGHITRTAKANWTNTDLHGILTRALLVPINLDTDVNFAALGEYLFGAGRGLGTMCYATVGTGIGVGIVADGKPFGGANHPECGHMLLPRAEADAGFAGVCPYHGDCLEGLASGPAILARKGEAAESLSPDDPVWMIEAEYLAMMCVNLTYSVRPERILLGGGVMQQSHLMDLLRERFAARLAGYDAGLGAIDLASYLQCPNLGTSAGIYGALAAGYYELEGVWPLHWSPALLTA